MNRASSCIGLVAAGTLLVSCGSSNSSSGTQTTSATCVSPGPGCRVTVDPPSVVRTVTLATDGVSTAVVAHTADKTCMSGKVDPGPSGAGWGTALIFDLGQEDDATSTVIAAFDAKARGITQVRFNVSSPPPTGLLPDLVELSSADCTKTSDCLAQFVGPPAITDPVAITLALGDFVTDEAGPANLVSDPTIMVALQFVVRPQSSGPFDYNFCIQGIQFLDATGNAVSR